MSTLFQTVKQSVVKTNLVQCDPLSFSYFAFWKQSKVVLLRCRKCSEGSVISANRSLIWYCFWNALFHYLVQFESSLTLRLHDAIYRLGFYSNMLINIVSLSNLHNNVVSLQKSRGDKSQRAPLDLDSFSFQFWKTVVCWQQNSVKQ